ncbi:hypothetical protein RI367_002107 [Sorochytrium milnesiophthora]
MSSWSVVRLAHDSDGVEDMSKIDLRDADEYAAQHRDRYFSLPLSRFRTRQAFPWFIMPDKTATRLSLCCPYRERGEQDYGDAIGPPSTNRQDDPFSQEGRAEDAVLRFVRHIVAKGWRVSEVWWPSATVAAAPPGGIDQMDLPYTTPAPLVQWTRVAVSELQTSAIRVVDLGCGAGRDTGFLLHHYPRIHVAAVDSWRGSCDRVQQLAELIGASAERLRVVRAQLGEFGSVKALPWGSGGQQLQTFHIVLMNRFLVPRNSVRWLHGLVERGGYLMISTFCNHQGLSLAEWTRLHESPSAYDNLLARDELTRDIDEKLVDMPRAHIEQEQHVDGWGWGLNRSNGFTVLENSIHHLADGRPLLWFVAQRG